MPFKQFPAPSSEWKTWGSALVGELEKTDMGVPQGVIAIVAGRVPDGWREYLASGMPSLPSGNRWVVKG